MTPASQVEAVAVKDKDAPGETNSDVAFSIVMDGYPRVVASSRRGTSRRAATMQRNKGFRLVTAWQISLLYADKMRELKWMKRASWRSLNVSWDLLKVTLRGCAKASQHRMLLHVHCMLL